MTLPSLADLTHIFHDAQVHLFLHAQVRAREQILHVLLTPPTRVSYRHGANLRRTKTKVSTVGR